MKRVFIALIVLNLAFCAVYAQENDLKKGAQLTCKCLDSLSYLSSFKVKCDSCFTSSAVAVLKQGSKGTLPATVEGLGSFINALKAQTYKDCPAYRQGVNDEQGKIYEKLSKDKDANALYDSGIKKMQATNYDEAITDFENAVKLDDGFLYAVDNIAVCYRKKGDYKNAMKYYKRSLKIFPAAHLALLNSGVVCTLSKDYKQALNYYEQLKYYYPEDPEGYFGAGKSNLLLENYSPALDDAFTAYLMYQKLRSPYLQDGNSLIGLLYSAMKKKDLLDTFQQKANQYHITINLNN